MKNKLLLTLLILSIVLISGCDNDLLISKCLEAKESTLRLIEKIDEYNSMENKYGDNISYETDIKVYNKLCGEYTGNLE